MKKTALSIFYFIFCQLYSQIDPDPRRFEYGAGGDEVYITDEKVHVFEVS